MRAAIYARMSTDKQSEASPEDQVAECRRYAGAEGLEVVDELVFVDRAISGATSARPQYQAMRRALQAGAFDVLLAFDGSRIARNERDFFELLDDLEAQQVRAVSVSTRQPLDELSERFLSVVSAHDRRRIATATRRGLQARARAGKATGGRPYGYAIEEHPEGGKRLVVEPSEAAIVVRIFEYYSKGMGLKALAHELNRTCVPAPRARGEKGKGAAWAPSAIREMLRNETYIGRLVYNRSRWVRQRDGKRRRVERPQEEWIVQQVPELRIVDQGLWDAVHETIAARGRQRDGMPAAGGDRARRHLLAGLLRCKACGYSFCADSASGYFACSGRRNRGACDVALRVRHDEIAERVVGALEAAFLDEERIARVVERAEALVEDALATGRLEQDAAELRAVERKIRRVGELFADEEDDLEAARLRKQLRDLRKMRQALRERIEGAQAGARVDREHIRARLAELGADLRATMLNGADAARDALAAVLAEDDRGARKLEIEVDPEAPGGYRITGRWRVAVPAKEETGRTDTTGLRRMVAGA